VSVFAASLKRCSWAVVAAAAAAGCTTRQVVSGPDLAGLPALVHAGETVRVTTAASSVELEVVSIEDGLLRGTTAGGETVPVRMADVTAVEHRTRAPGKTAGVVIGALFGAGILAVKDSCKPVGPYGESKCDANP
jgi:hypothetical protein